MSVGRFFDERTHGHAHGYGESYCPHIECQAADRGEFGVYFW